MWDIFQQERVEIYLLPEITIGGRLYRASNIRLNGSGKKWADVDYWDGREWFG